MSCQNSDPLNPLVNRMKLKLFYSEFLFLSELKGSHQKKIGANQKPVWLSNIANEACDLTRIVVINTIQPLYIRGT